MGMSDFDKKDAPGNDHESIGKKLNRFLRKNAAGETDIREEIRRRRKGLDTGRIIRSTSDGRKEDSSGRGNGLLRQKTEPLRQAAEKAARRTGLSRRSPDEGNKRADRAGSVKERRERRVSWRFMFPSVAGVALFFLIPFFVVIYYSLIDNPVRHKFVGFANYVKVFNNSAFRLASLNSLKFSLVAVPLAVALSLLLAVVMEQNLPWKSRFRSFFLSPMMVPTASVIMIWQILFHYNGLVNVLLGGLTHSKIDWLKSAYAQIPVILLFLWKNLGYNMILFMSGLANIPRDQIEVARLEGATDFQIFWLIKIRYLSSTLLFVTIMSLINSFKVFREVYLMGGDYPYDALYMLQHFMNNTFKSLDYQKLSAAAVMMAVFMVFVIGALFLAENRFGKDLE